MKEIILVGSFLETVELAEASRTKIIGIIEKDNDENKSHFEGIPILGTDEDLPDMERLKKIPLVVAPDSPSVRQKLYEKYSQMGFQFGNLIHPGASISPSARLGKGLVISDRAYISSRVTLDDFVKINIGATFMHDVSVGAFTTVAPGALLLGNVCVGRRCYVGANATLLPQVSIGDECLVGACANVTKSFPDQCTLTGNPAQLNEDRKKG